MRAEARGWCASGACCCYPSGWQAAQGVQPASLASATDMLLDVALGHEADEDAVGPWYLGTPGTTVTRSAPWCGVAFRGGRRLAPGFAGRRGGPARQRRPRGLAVAPVVARRAASASLAARSRVAPGPGNAMMSASDSPAAAAFAGSASEPSAASAPPASGSARRRFPRRRRSGVGGRASRDVLAAGIGGGAGRNRGLALRCGAGDRGRDGLGRLAVLVRVVIEPGVAGRPVVVLVARTGVTGGRAAGSRVASSLRDSAWPCAAWAARDRGRALPPGRQAGRTSSARPPPRPTAGRLDGRRVGGSGVAATARPTTVVPSRPAGHRRRERPTRLPGRQVSPPASCPATRTARGHPRRLAHQLSARPALSASSQGSTTPTARAPPRSPTAALGPPAVPARPLPCAPRKSQRPPTTMPTPTRPPWAVPPKAAA